MDWKNIIAELINEGLRQTEIAQTAGVSQAVISDLLHGKQRTVAWEIGERLLALHKLRTGKVVA